jgi:hypothetical protein
VILNLNHYVPCYALRDWSAICSCIYVEYKGLLPNKYS